MLKKIIDLFDQKLKIIGYSKEIKRNIKEDSDLCGYKSFILFRLAISENKNGERDIHLIPILIPDKFILLNSHINIYIKENLNSHFINAIKSDNSNERINSTLDLNCLVNYEDAIYNFKEFKNNFIFNKDSLTEDKSFKLDLIPVK